MNRLICFGLALALSAGAAEVSVSGSLRSRIEAWDWFSGSPYAFNGNILRVAITGKQEGWSWNVELAAPILLGLPTTAAGGTGANYLAANDRRGSSAMIFPKQAYVFWKGLKVGRFEYVDGTEFTPSNPTLAALKRERIAHRLIGHFAWTHVGRSFDGFHLNKPVNGMNLTVVGAAPTRGVFQVDGWAPLKIGFGYAALSGGKKNYDWRLFTLSYKDWRVPFAREVQTYGGHLIGTVGQFDYLAWTAIQHKGNATALEAGYQPKGLLWKPWIRGGVFHGSSRFFNVLPTPRIYARLPFYNLMNNQDRFGSLILRPHAKLNIRGDFHALRLADAKAPYYSGGGAFQPWTLGYVARPSGGARSLGNLADIGADYNANKNVTFSAYYGKVLGRSVLQKQNAQFAYAEITYRFQ